MYFTVIMAQTPNINIFTQRLEKFNIFILNNIHTSTVFTQLVIQLLCQKKSAILGRELMTQNSQSTLSFI